MTLPLKIFAGVLIPSFATIIFNVLNFFVDNYHTSPLPQLSESVFDISVGCTFALFGIGIAAAERHRGEWLTAVSVILMLAIIGIDILAPVILHWQKWPGILAMDVASVVALSWGIAQIG